MAGGASSSRSPDRSRRSEHARTAVLTAALEAVAELGYERMTVEAVAARAGVGKQTIYRWWPSKGAVLVDAFLEPGGSSSSDGDDEPLPTGGDIVGTLRSLIRSTVEEFSRTSFEAPYRAVVVAIQGDPDLADDVLRRLVRPSIEQVTAWLDDAIRRGALRPSIDTHVAFEMIFGPIFHRWMLRTAPLDDDYARKLSDLVVAALVEPSTVE